MTVRLCSLAIVLAGCLQSHDPGVVALQQETCVTCHTIEYEATSAPPHSTSGYPRTCVDCHRTSGWRPALGGTHPDAAFPIAASPHTGIACLECHDLDIPASSMLGANTNCVQCHPSSAYLQDAHVGARGPANEPYAYTAEVKNFCRTCHPKGLANKHPDTQFPRTGPHATSCTNCHDRTAGPDTDGMNTTCVRSGCHSLAEEDASHREEGGYTTRRGDGSNKHFCLVCHPTGRN